MKTLSSRLNELPFSYEDFARNHLVTLDDICGNIYRNAPESLRIKNEERVVRNLARILKAVLILAHQKGFHAMSLRDISRESKLSMGGLYAYFGSKDDLLRMLLNEGQATVNRVLNEQLSFGESASERLAIGICTHLYLSEMLQKMFYFFYMEAKNLDSKSRTRAVALEQEGETVFATILADGAKTGEFNVEDPRLVASVLKAMLQDWYLKRYKYSRRRIGVEDYARVIIGMVESFVR